MARLGLAPNSTRWWDTWRRAFTRTGAPSRLLENFGPVLRVGVGVEVGALVDEPLAIVIRDDSHR
jgi:hypothetical protein